MIAAAGPAVVVVVGFSPRDSDSATSTINSSATMMAKAIHVTAPGGVGSG